MDPPLNFTFPLFDATTNDQPLQHRQQQLDTVDDLKLQEFRVDADLLKAAGNLSTSTVYAPLALVHAIVSRKLYKHAGHNLEDYYKSRFGISRAQVYRVLDCASLYLDFELRFPSLPHKLLEPYPLKQRLCKTIRSLAPTPYLRQLLWHCTLKKWVLPRSPHSTPPMAACLVVSVDELTSKHVRDVWDLLVLRGDVRALLELAINEVNHDSSLVVDGPNGPELPTLPGMSVNLSVPRRLRSPDVQRDAKRPKRTSSSATPSTTAGLLFKHPPDDSHKIHLTTYPSYFQQQPTSSSTLPDADLAANQNNKPNTTYAKIEHPTSTTYYLNTHLCSRSVSPLDDESGHSGRSRPYRCDSTTSDMPSPLLIRHPSPPAVQGYANNQNTARHVGWIPPATSSPLNSATSPSPNQPSTQQDMQMLLDDRGIDMMLNPTSILNPPLPSIQSRPRVADMDVNSADMHEFLCATIDSLQELARRGIVLQPLHRGSWLHDVTHWRFFTHSESDPPSSIFDSSVDLGYHAPHNKDTQFNLYPPAGAPCNTSGASNPWYFDPFAHPHVQQTSGHPLASPLALLDPPSKLFNSAAHVPSSGIASRAFTLSAPVLNNYASSYHATTDTMQKMSMATIDSQIDLVVGSTVFPDSAQHSFIYDSAVSSANHVHEFPTR